MTTLASMKNVIPKRKYRERSQPEKRKHLGLLEKKGDYKLRAKDYHAKEDKINQLKTKARLRNPDEFYFKMVNSKVEDGRHVEYLHNDDDDDEESIAKNKEFKKVMITQGANAVKLQKYRDSSKVRKMKAEMQLLDFPKENKHTIFVDNLKKFENFNPVEHFNTVPELLDQPYNRIKKEQLENVELNANDVNVGRLAEKVKAGYKKLADKMENEKKMEEFYLRLDYEKQLLNNDKKKLKKYKTGEQYKFFMERKR